MSERLSENVVRPVAPDQEHRDRIASDLESTMLVEAGAGTGKTTCLVARMVGLLGEGICRIETIAAVTFTRKAAAELRTRFQLALERAVQEGVGEGGKRERLQESLAHVERCFIGTIHSFCARLLRERPVEAGVDPSFVELDSPADAQLRQQAWREHVAALIATDAPVVPELERLGLEISPSTRRSSSLVTELDELRLEPAELGPAFLMYAEFPDVDDWPAPSAPMPDLNPCRQALDEYTRHMRATKLPADYGNDELMPKYELIGRMVQRLDVNQPAQLMEVLEEFSEFERGKVIQKNWPGKKAQALAELDRWNDFVRQYAAPLVLAWREHRYEPVMRAIRPARGVYDRLRRERNGLNFQDLLLLSAAMLRGYPEVRRYFRERFTHLLVDEFQDTDPIQAEVMLLLAADDFRETNWQRCRPVPGSLFVVGDPKQSIYRFRRADILTYNKVREIILGVGGQVVPLTANFRSVEPVVKWVNGCFSNVFPSRDDYNPADRPLLVGRSETSGTLTGRACPRPGPETLTGQGPAVERLSAQPPIRANDQLADFEADVIARTIRRAIDEKRPVARTLAERQLGLPEHALPGDFLIVARIKTRLSIYARKLQQYGLPHIVTGGSVLNEVPELELLSTCLSAVVRPHDPIALVAVLRSELFGVSAAALYDYRRLGGRFSYHAEIPAGLPQNEAAVFSGAFGRLQTYSRWLRRVPAAAAMERIAADLGLIAQACASEDGDAHAGSLLKAIELLRSADGQLTAGDYIDSLKQLVDQEEQHDGVPVRPSAEAPVRVMNLHQCKGLEAPFVFLVDPSGDKDHDVGVYIDRSVLLGPVAGKPDRSVSLGPVTDKPDRSGMAGLPRGYLAVYGPRRSQYGPPPLLAHPPGWEELAAEEQKFLDAETKRLLYVAATRAGVKLVISQREGNANRANPWRFFEGDLQSAAALADPGAVPPKTRVEIKFDKTDWEQEVAAIEQRWQAVVQPTYAVQAIKQAAIKGNRKPHGAEEQGAEWGEVLHTLLEAAMKRPQADLRSLALSALEREGLPIALVGDAVATVERVIASDLWKRARQGQTCLVEVPLGVLVARQPASGGLPTVLRGVIDLVFREPPGWVIVDYKSERVQAADIPALIAYYRPQIEAYAATWQQVVGQPVVERGLFFTQTGDYRTV